MKKKQPPDYVLMFAGVWSASMSTSAGLGDFCGRVAFSLVFAVISLASFAELFERNKGEP